MLLNEYCQFDGTIDESSDEITVIRNVKILGLTSSNGYTYDRQAVAKAIHLYENAPAYVDHGKGSRSYKDRFGYFRSPRLDEQGEGRADFYCNPRHPIYSQFLWDAQQSTAGVGFSHSIDGTLNKRTNIVESISKVFSVDLVASPATVKSLFESEEVAPSEEANPLEDMKAQLAALVADVAALKVEVEKLKPQAEAAEAAAESVRVQTGQIQELTKQVEQITKKKPVYIVPTAEPVSQDTTRADFLKKIKR